MIPVADPTCLDVPGLIEEERVFQAEIAAKHAKLEKEKEEAAAKAKELRDAKRHSPLKRFARRN